VIKLLKQMPRNLVMINIALFTWGIGEGMFLIFQPIYLETWGANPVEIGAIFSAMGIAMAVVQAPAGILGDRVGSHPITLASWILGTVAAVMMALANSLPWFIAGMLTYGLTSFVVAPMNSYITSVRGKLSVERSLTITMASFFTGAVAGPLIGGIVGEAFGLNVVYRVSAGIFFVSTLIVLQTRRPPLEEHAEFHANQPNLARNPRFIGLLGLSFITMFALNLPQPLTPNYLQNQQGFSLQTIGQLGAVGSLGNALLMLGLGHLAAPAGFMIGQILVGLFALLMWRSQSLGLFFLGYFLLGGYRLARSMVLAFARTFVKANEIGFAFGLVETGNAVACILAPLAAGLLYTRDPQSMYIASLVVIVLVLLINFLLLPRHKVSGQAVSQVSLTIGKNDAP
jgi:MFS family permease